MNTSRSAPRGQTGASMIEVLVTMVILLVGLLGLAGLQAQGLRSEMESYQRVQALILLQDMVGRINANRKVASCYVITTTTNGTPYLGTAGTNSLTLPPTCTLGTAQQNAQAIQDMTDWDALLTGAAETSGGARVGAMIGARGCVSYNPDMLTYMVSVAWQGLGKTFANTNLTCGQNLYGATAADDNQRRVVGLSIRIATLL